RPALDVLHHEEVAGGAPPRVPPPLQRPGDGLVTGAAAPLRPPPGPPPRAPARRQARAGDPPPAAPPPRGPPPRPPRPPPRGRPLGTRWVHGPTPAQAERRLDAVRTDALPRERRRGARRGARQAAVEDPQGVERATQRHVEVRVRADQILGVLVPARLAAPPPVRDDLRDAVLVARGVTVRRAAVGHPVPPAGSVAARAAPTDAEPGSRPRPAVACAALRDGGRRRVGSVGP